MNNYNELNLYLVAEGVVTAANSETEHDGHESVLVAATSEASALRIAADYDAGLIGYDNLVWGAETIGVVCKLDPETGNYL